MYKSKLRLLGVSALVGAGLIAAGPAEAYNVRLGNVDIQVDSSLSLGASWKMKDTNSAFLAQANGGNDDTRPVVSFFGYGAALATPMNAAEAAAAANAGTATNITAGSCGYTALCLTVGATEAGALNAAYQGGVAKATRAGVLAADPTATQNAQDLAAASAVAALPAANLTLPGATNFDASINGDDGRLNFEKGDMISQTTKFLTEIEARMGNFRGFMRINGFYDSVMDDDDNFLRSTGGILDEGRDLAVTDLQVLDAFVDYDTNIGDIPVLIRVGNQVINWGESTFFSGGNSVFNAIDVPAIRRPGAEIKDALLPVEAAYVSASLTDAISVEAYIGGHEKFKLDVGGTHFANSDVLVNGTGIGGNNGIGYVGGGQRSGSNKLNLDNAVTGIAGINALGLHQGTAALQAAIAANADHPANARLGNLDHPQHYTNGAPLGELETFRTKWEDTNQIDHLGDLNVSEDAMGLALRYYAENLNSTEFGFYYQKYTSRIPYVGYRANQPGISLGATGESMSATTAALAGRSACSRATFGQAVSAQAAVWTNDVADTITIGNDAGDDINDENHNWAAMKAAGQAMYASLAGEDIYYHYHTEAAAHIQPVLMLSVASGGMGMDAATAQATSRHIARVSASRDVAPFGAAVLPLTGALTSASHAAATTADANNLGLTATAAGILKTLIDASGTNPIGITPAEYDDWTNKADATTGNKPYEVADFTAAQTTGAGWFAMEGISNPTGDTYLDLMDAQCLIGIGNGSADGATDHDWYGDYTLNGAMHGAIAYDSDLFVYYPEDIEAYGISFNTTAFGWGIQGEFVSRPDMPLLVDTDSTFIASVAAQCAFPINGDAGVFSYAPLVTHGTICEGTVGKSDHFSHVELDVYNWDIGTTATYTRSNPIVAALGADLGVLLTEFGGVSVPDIDETYAKEIDPKTGELSGKDQVKRLQGICTSGSDLPLGSLLDFDARLPNECRPTENSYGGLILTSLQYNNVFGTPWAVTPTLIMREGLHGFSPSPAGSFRKGVGSTSISVSGSYQGYLTLSLSYTDYTGDELYSKSIDQNYASFSVNYAF